MPEGVIADVREGFATIEFVDPALKGPGLARLLATGGPVDKITREGRRAKYRVAEGNAREAGLIDVPKPPPAEVKTAPYKRRGPKPRAEQPQPVSQPEPQPEPVSAEPHLPEPVEF